jgi:hypothetical protein
MKISSDFVVLGNVLRNKDKLTVVVPSVGDRRLVVICLTLITSKPRLISLSYTGRGKLASFFHIHIHIKKEVSLPHLVYPLQGYYVGGGISQPLQASGILDKM